MSKLNRYPLSGRPCFVTSVTLERNPILVEFSHIFLAELDTLSTYSPAVITAWSLLPDHFHLIIDTMEDQLPRVMQRFKIRLAHGIRVQLELNQLTVWQRRYWDHVIRDEQDLRRHLDYIHYNPVKHGYVNNPTDWELSSYHGFVQKGQYPRNWGVKEEMVFEGDYGE